MSDVPSPSPNQPSSNQPAPNQPQQGQPVQGLPPMTWMQRISSVLFVMLTLELGLFLLIYPWMDSWERNYLLALRPQWAEFFLSSQFRGALSGLGVLNLMIAANEFLRFVVSLARRRG
jgi:hypothetical protein